MQTKTYWTPGQAFLLDWDGVIADTKLDFSELRKKYFNGQGMLLEDGAKLPQPVRDEFFKELVDLETAGAERAAAIAGARELLAYLEKNQIPYCILSRNCTSVIELCAKNIGIKLPEHTFTRDNMPFVKPNPKALYAAAKAIDASPRECVYVGDFLYDIQGARRAGMRAVLVERIEDEWVKWTDAFYPHVTDFLAALISPQPIVPWEYREVVHKKGKEYFEKAAGITVKIPDKPSPTLDCWLARAAALGIRNFYIDEDKIFTPDDWKDNPSFSPEYMWCKWIDVINEFFAPRFPLAHATGDITDAVTAPKNSLDLMRFVERKKN